MPTRPARRGPLVVVFLAVSAFYYWSATAGGEGLELHEHLTDPYNRLADAFVSGRLWLPITPPPGLEALRDPYNPVANAAYRRDFWDLVYYHGHFFLSWGATPAVTFFLPFRLLHLGDLPENLAVILACVLGYGFLLGALAFLVRTYLPGTTTWRLCLLGAALGFADGAPFLLRRPAVYEVAISAGFCFSMAALYLLARGALGGRLRRWPLAAGSLCVGLAFGARPTTGLVGLLLPVGLAVLGRAGGLRGRRLVAAGALALVPAALGVGAVLAYNQARFSSPFQFGIAYQLAGVDQSHMALFSPRALLAGAYYYFVEPFRLSFAFPYAFLGPPPSYPGRVPSGYIALDTAGLFLTAPFVVLGLALAPRVLRRARGGLGLVAGAILATGAVIAVIVAAYPAGATLEYELDFAPYVLFFAALVLAEPAGWRRSARGPSRAASRLVAALLVLGVLASCAANAAFSFVGYYDTLRYYDPDTFWRLAADTSLLPRAFSVLEGHPLVVRVISPVLGEYGTAELSTARFYLGRAPVELDVVAPHAGTWRLAETFVRDPLVPAAVRVEMTLSDGRRVARRVLSDSPYGPSLSLSGGLNRIELSASSSSRLSPTLAAALVVVEGVRLAGSS